MAQQSQDPSQDATQSVGATPQDRIYAAQADFVREHIITFTTRNSLNPDGKSFRQWNAEDLARVPTEGLNRIRAMFFFENYDLVDQIKPTAMTRAEFSRSVLRELGRRGDIMDYYENRMPFSVNTVTVARPQEAPLERRVTVTEDPAFITARDAAIGILRNPRLGAITVQPDVMEQTGLRPDPLGRPPGFGIQTDTSAYDLGYTMGAAPQNRPNGSTPLTLIYDKSDAEIRYGYCAATNNIYAQRGRTIDQQEAFSAGWLQGRQDTSTNFAPTDMRIGVLGSVCPLTTPPLDTNARQMLALRGSRDGLSAN